ncbi:DUF371 domain-containing protein [Nitrosopumilus sp. K4]|uniref:DUF371 domain-containing protein n=1 Tax=Nitrosopumilus sp. K4 TaxID=2795383 RepID=UPI001BACA2A2|nr:DUF371 domain-containing protein [Nitrosopumilus sp. K4]QUC65397.1 DUF371 domain-containing protein [Nitrosopumilus sp. K4]
MQFEIDFFGHENIRSNHQKTIEITKESDLTPQGDCIIGVNATSSCSDLPLAMKEKLKDPKTKVSFLIKVDEYEFTVEGRGHENLSLTHSEDIVIRKSDFVCPRTLAVKCDKASDVLPREMVSLLRNPKTKGKFVIIIE